MDHFAIVCAGLENFSILLGGLFVLVFGGIVLAMVAVGTPPAVAAERQDIA